MFVEPVIRVLFWVALLATPAIGGALLFHRRRRAALWTVVAGASVAALAYVLHWPARSHDAARRLEARVREVGPAFEARLDVAAAIEVDAAGRPPVLETSIDLRRPRAVLAVHFATKQLGSDAKSDDPLGTACQRLRDAEIRDFGIPRSMEACLRADTIAIVRRRSEGDSARFVGDALFYALADGRYLGGVAIDLADDSHLLEEIEHRLRTELSAYEK